MATASKSNHDPILEEKFLAFLRERVERHGVLSIKNLTGHLSALAPRVRNHFGSSRGCLKQFLAEHPKVFFVDKKENVKIVTDELLKKREECFSNHSAEKAVQEIALTSSSPVSERASTPKKNFSHFPNELVEVRGKVYRIFPAFGFISVSSPVVCSVYFNVACYENGIVRGMRGHTEISIGEGVCLNAKKGPDGCEAQYRATRVWPADPSTARHTTVSESSTRSGRSSPGVSSSSKVSRDRNEISGTGKIENVFIKFGFISQSKKVKDNIFFHMKNVHVPNERRISNLLGVLKQGDEVSFSAVPTEQKTAMVRWQATNVWLNKDDAFSGSEIFVSSPECSESSESDHLYPNSEEMDQLNAMTEAERAKMVNGLNSKKAVRSTDVLPEKRSATDYSPKKGTRQPRRETLDTHSRTDLSSSSNTGTSPVTETGSIWLISEHIASIHFGDDQKALALVDVFYQCEERIDNFMWELEDGQRIQFEAVEDKSWAPETPWKVSIAWVGRKPDVLHLSPSDLKGLYETYAQDIPAVVSFSPVWPQDIPAEPEYSDPWQEPPNAPIDDDEDEDDVDFLGRELNDHMLNNDGDDEDSIDMSSDLSDENSDEEEEIKENGIDDMAVEGTVSNDVDNGPSGNIETGDITATFGFLDVVHHAERETSQKGSVFSSPEREYVKSENSKSTLEGYNAPTSVPTTATTTSLESRIVELTLMVQELLRRNPATVSTCHKATQTEASATGESTVSEAHRLNAAGVDEEVQTVSTGHLLYTQLYHNQ